MKHIVYKPTVRIETKFDSSELSETDIYWILNKRRRLNKELENTIYVKNKITFYTNENNQLKISILEPFGVPVIYKTFDHKEIYKYAPDNIK